MPKYRKMLGDWNAPYIQALVAVINTQSKTTLVTWVLDYAERVILPLWDTQSDGDLRPKIALDAARAWLAGEIKLPQAKPLILDCHTAARESESNPIAQAAARAVGQSASAIHAATHCIGLAYYGALAVAYDQCGIDAPWAELESAAAIECGKMLDALRAIAVENEPNPAKLNWNC